MALFLGALDVPGFTLGAYGNNPKSFELMSTIKTSIAFGKNLLFFTDVDQAEARPRTHLLTSWDDLSTKE
jgi:hypothetical protein